jgi:hypothetical protein
MTKMTKGKIRVTIAIVALLFLAPLIPASGGIRNQSQDASQDQPTDKAQIKGKVVYVCACLQTKSCSCMTEAKTEGPCSCGTEGGPPMKAVPKDSSWAKANRQELGK